MNAYIKNNLKQALLILEGEGTIEDDFQIFMLQGNKIEGLLNTEIKYIDDKTLYRYDISGKNSLQTKHEKNKMSREDIEKLVCALLKVLREIQKYMLDSSGILLSPEYIYCEEDKNFFCYYPPCTLELTEEFHKLTEFLVREVDYRDKEGIHLAYTLHKSSMEDNYSIEKIMDEVLREEAEPVVRYNEQMEEWEEEKLEGNMVIAEKKDFWEPIRRLLDRRNREKRDDWDEMPLEEGEQ